MVSVSKPRGAPRGVGIATFRVSEVSSDEAHRAVSVTQLSEYRKCRLTTGWFVFNVVNSSSEFSIQRKEKKF